MSCLPESFKSCVSIIQQCMCVCMTPVASGTNALNLLYPPFMRGLIPFQDIAFIFLPYHHYFNSDWCSHEISLPFRQAHLPPLLSHSPPYITCSLGHLWSLQESLCLSSDHPLSVTEHIGLLILPGAILEKKRRRRKKRGTEMTASASGSERGHISYYYQSNFFFSLLLQLAIFQPLILAHST